MDPMIRNAGACAALAIVAGCSKPTMDDWNRELKDVVAIESTTMQADGSTSTSAVCVADPAGGKCIKATMERDPFQRVRTFYVSNQASMSARTKGSLTPYVELDDQGVPVIRMLSDVQHADIQIVVDGDLAFATGLSSLQFHPDEVQWGQLRRITAGSDVAVRLKGVEHTPAPYTTVVYPLSPSANRQFASEFERALKIHDTLVEALEPVADPGRE